MIRFTYGPMKAGKTARLIGEYVCASENKKTLVLRPSVDTRSAEGMIESRSGAQLECTVFSGVEDLKNIKFSELEVVFVDEVQFLDEEVIQYMVALATATDIDFYFYGLLTDFNGEVFPSSLRILSCSHHVDVITVACPTCGNSALWNKYRYSEELDGNNIVVGDDDNYSPACTACFLEVKKDETN